MLDEERQHVGKGLLLIFQATAARHDARVQRKVALRVKLGRFIVPSCFSGTERKDGLAATDFEFWDFEVLEAVLLASSAVLCFLGAALTLILPALVVFREVEINERSYQFFALSFAPPSASLV